MDDERTTVVPDDQIDDSGIDDAEPGDTDTQSPDPEGGTEGFKDLFPEEADKGKEKTVPLKALKAERSKRQQYERQVQELIAMNKQLMAQLSPRRQNDEPEETMIDEDSIITGADLKRILEKERSKLMRQTSQQTASQALMMAKQRYDDFDDVVELADDLIRSNPVLHGLEEYILSKPNAPLIAYELGKLHPNYQKRTAKQQSLQDKIEKNMKTPRPLQRSTPDISDFAERIKGLDPLSKEFEELDKNIMKRIRKYDEYYE